MSRKSHCESVRYSFGVKDRESYIQYVVPRSMPMTSPRSCFDPLSDPSGSWSCALA